MIYTRLVIAVIMLLLLSFPAVAGEEIHVLVGEGEFTFKNVQIMKQLPKERASQDAMQKDLAERYRQLGWDSRPFEQDLTELYLTGTVTNNTNKTWTAVEFEFFLFDEQGTQLDKKFYNVRAIGPGQEIALCEGPSDHVCTTPIRLLKYLLHGRVARIDARYVFGTYPASYKVSMVKPKASNDLSFEDMFLRIDFRFSKTAISFTIKSKSDNPIKIDWNQMSYVGSESKSHRIIHSQIKFVEKEKPQTPTIIPPQAIIDDAIIPLDNVRYSEPGRAWVEDELFPDAPAGKALKGNTFGVFMPLDINGQIKNYFFTFRIDDVVT